MQLKPIPRWETGRGAFLFLLVVVVMAGAFARTIASIQTPPPTRTIEAASFKLSYDEKGITGIANPQDRYAAGFLARGSHLGNPLVRYKIGDANWVDLSADGRRLEADPGNKSLVYSDVAGGSPLKMIQRFRVSDNSLDWTVAIENVGGNPVVVGDLAIPIPWQFPAGDNPDQIFEKSFTKHHFISGHGSFLYFTRPNGEPPYLVITVHPGTKLEYYTTEGRGSYRAYIHSAVTGKQETRGTWRQEHTSLNLGAAGSESNKATYGFKFRWAKSYDEIRQILYDEGLFDIRVVPGMTVPEDLSAKFSLHTRSRIESIEPEFPKETRLVSLSQSKPGYHLFEVEFKHLGENRLTIRHDGGRQTYLEFFATEPLETLIKKRSWFITHRQQHRDPSKWYDGLFSVYDARNKILRGPDNTDGFDGWWGYVLACDDPGLSKAPYVAAKNTHFPDREEIAAVEYYLEHFVWGKLQRTDKELPYPYGIYGVPNWKVARDPELRKLPENRDRNQDKMHIWRSYDYPHIVMLYFHMYEIAKMYPGMTRYLDAAGYLDRAYQTARAYFIHPYEILPWYETYKWGCYNELVILDLIAALEKEGFKDRADWLRAEWEKKVKYFVYDDKYPFRSEYAIDRTAFESSYALAKYGSTHDMKPDTNLWFDKNRKKSYSHPIVRREDSREFMERQLRAGLAVRGWIESSYYLLGADFTASSDTGAMSYMANMGGWGILDYAVNFAESPQDWLQLGYASYLSSWSLMNTGRADTNYGFWFPGKENDGAAGWQFMTAKFGRAWIRKEVPRGPWHYDGEIDLGFGGGLRMAATILTRDPLFDWTAYGGKLTGAGDQLSIIPRDGLRQRFYAILPGERLKIELDRDGFAAGTPIVTDKGLKRVRWTVENRTGDDHSIVLRISSTGKAGYTVLEDGKRIGAARAGGESTIDAKMSKASLVLELVRQD
ncbi:MAG TPA: DUF5695 domain-containing protein [Blastocatellia bacterium]|nr:DUF5695 domain-containing protein [Blastocatellia bacterium]